MTDSRIYVDTAPFIYFLEKSALYFDVARSFFIDCKNQSIQLFTSTVTIEEFCVYPLSHNDRQAIVNFETFLNGMNINVVPVDKSIALKAAEIRAKYTGFKALDAIHLATATLTNCDAFITNDKQLLQIKEIPVHSMDMLKKK